MFVEDDEFELDWIACRMEFSTANSAGRKRSCQVYDWEFTLRKVH